MYLSIRRLIAIYHFEASAAAMAGLQGLSDNSTSAKAATSRP
jgi:hypothetical protein